MSAWDMVSFWIDKPEKTASWNCSRRAHKTVSLCNRVPPSWVPEIGLSEPWGVCSNLAFGDKHIVSEMLTAVVNEACEWAALLEPKLPAGAAIQEVLCQCWYGGHWQQRRQHLAQPHSTWSWKVSVPGADPLPWLPSHRFFFYLLAQKENIQHFSFQWA